MIEQSPKSGLSRLILDRLVDSVRSCHHAVLGTEILIKGGELCAVLSISECYGVGLMLAIGGVIALVKAQLRRVAVPADAAAQNQPDRIQRSSVAGRRQNYLRSASAAIHRRAVRPRHRPSLFRTRFPQR